MLKSGLVGGRGGFESELFGHVGPVAFRADPLFRNGLDPVADLGTGIGGNGVFDGSFVVVDEESGREEVGELLFELVKLDCGADGVRGATAEVSLVVDGRAFWSEIYFGGQCLEVDESGAEQVVAVVGKVWDPAVAWGAGGGSGCGCSGFAGSRFLGSTCAHGGAEKRRSTALSQGVAEV